MNWGIILKLCNKRIVECRIICVKKRLRGVGKKLGMNKKRGDLRQGTGEW